MCGRISQARDLMDYYSSLGLPPSVIFDKMPPPRRYNVAPGTEVGLIHSLDHRAALETVRWGYHTRWAQEKKLPPTVNATIEKARSPYWRTLWKTGRAIVPADGWYEWTGERGNKQPWFIKPKLDGPLYLCALTGFKPGVEEQAYGAGFALLTSEAAGGMLDIHDRRPIALTSDDATMWMALSWSAEQAEQLARTAALPSDAFAWYQVTRDANKATNDGPEMVQPLDAAQ